MADAVPEPSRNTRPPPVVAVVSMLHEPGDVNSATRRFAGQPVLSHTVARLSACTLLDGFALLCWDDQANAAGACVGEAATIVPLGTRQPVPAIEILSAAQRWADGWRGGLLSTCAADRGWHAPSVQAIVEATDAAAVFAVDASFGQNEPDLVDALIQHARGRWEVGCDEPVYFTPAPPGACGLLVTRAAVAQLAAESDSRRQHPGRLLHYLPDAPRIDPIGLPACRHASDPALARSTRDRRLDSNHQIIKQAARPELTIELTTRRRSSPLWLQQAEAFDADPDTIQAEIARHADGADDLRVTFAGRGDPLLHPQWPSVLAATRAAGVRALHVETDLLGITPAAMVQLAASGVDVVSVHLPAMTAATYAKVMGRNAMAEAVANLSRLIAASQANGGLPLIVPTFTKLRHNVGEMEAWYDQWLCAVGNAVIRGPEAFGNEPPVPLSDLSAAPLARTERPLDVIFLPAGATSATASPFRTEAA